MKNSFQPFETRLHSCQTFNLVVQSLSIILVIVPGLRGGKRVIPVLHAQLQRVEEAEQRRKYLRHNALAHKVPRMTRHHQQTVKCLAEEYDCHNTQSAQSPAHAAPSLALAHCQRPTVAEEKNIPYVTTLLRNKTCACRAKDLPGAVIRIKKTSRALLSAQKKGEGLKFTKYCTYI